jgi:zinc transport system substrate-binding protein
MPENACGLLGSKNANELHCRSCGIIVTVRFQGNGGFFSTLNFFCINPRMRSVGGSIVGNRFLKTTLAALAVAICIPPPAAAKTVVFASILPQRYFIEQIAADRVDVQVMVSPGASPATYEPKPRQMAALSEASAYFAVGVPFETVWLEKIAAANPSMKIVHTENGIDKIPMDVHGHVHGGREDDVDHPPHTVLDPHVWTSPPLVMIQARNILSALIAIDPANQEHYVEHYKRFVRDLADLDTALMKLFSRRERLDRFMVFHPSWGYFADAYGLTQVPIEIEGKAPKPAHLAELIALAREHHVRVIFVQPQFSTQSAELIAREIGGRVVFADPLAADWAANLRKQADAFRDAMH